METETPVLTEWNTALSDEGLESKDRRILENEDSPKKWNFWRLSVYELARNEIFLRHRSSGDWK